MNQEEYFDVKTNRFSESQVLHPKNYQLLEYQTILSLIHPDPKSSIIDFGCGSGRLTFYLLQKGFNVTAVDISKKSLHDVGQIYKKHKTRSWGKLTISSDTEHIPKSRYIVGTDILHHINLEKYFLIFKKSLTKNGTIAFSEPNAWHLPWYLFLALEKIPWDIEKGILNCNIFTLKKILTQSGFEHTAFTGYGLFPMPLLKNKSLLKINYRTGNLTLLRPFAFRLLIVATP